MKKLIIGGIGLAVVSVVAAIVVSNVLKAKTMKQISEDSGVPLEDVKAEFKAFAKKAAEMKKEGASTEEIEEATFDFFQKFDSLSGRE